MDFHQWLTLQERTLYHGTVVDYEDSIRKYGLQGGWHEPEDTWVGDAYDGEYGDIPRTEDDDVVFMADKNKLHVSVSAMAFRIGKKLKKDFHSVTDNDIRNHGLLVIMKDAEADQYDPDDRRWRDDPPRGVEPGDYFASSMSGDIFLRGSALLRYLRRLGEWPRNWGPGDPKAREKLMRDKFGKTALAQNYFPTIAKHIAKDAPFDIVKNKLKEL